MGHFLCILKLNLNVTNMLQRTKTVFKACFLDTKLHPFIVEVLTAVPWSVLIISTMKLKKYNTYKTTQRNF